MLMMEHEKKEGATCPGFLHKHVYAGDMPTDNSDKQSVKGSSGFMKHYIAALKEYRTD